MSKNTPGNSEEGKAAPKKRMGINWVAVWVGFSIFLIGREPVLGGISLLLSIYVLYRQSKSDKQE